MKSTGIVRRVDDLGRVVLPKELRTVMGISERDPLEIFVDGTFVMLKKYEPACVFCSRSESISTFKSRNVCKACIEEMIAV